jgi:hypothetical protein
MGHPGRRSGYVRAACLVVAAAGLLFQQPIRAAEPGATDRVHARVDSAADHVAATAEVAFAEPVRCAVVASQTGRVQRLYRAGDTVLVSARDGVALRVQRIERDRLQVVEPGTGRATWVPVGRTIPGTLAWTLLSTPEIALIEYRYVWAAKSPDAEPRLVDVQDGRATVDVEIPGAPLPQPAAPLAQSALRRLDERLLSKLRLRPTQENTYEMSPADFRAALEEAGEVLSERWPSLSPTFSGGLGIRIDSAVCSGVMDAAGFKVTSPKLAERAGIELGDVIVAVNGAKVNSFGDVFNIYQQVRRNGRIADVQVDLVRRGQPVTKTYRIR